jgi:tRNA-intron endonuclease
MQDVPKNVSCMLLFSVVHYLNLLQEMFLKTHHVITGMELVHALLIKDIVCTENSPAARELFEKSHFGAPLADGRIQLSLLEAVYLAEKKRLAVLDSRKKPIPLEQLMKKASRREHDFWTRYAVFRDFRNRGYIVKTALKFGAEFRIYDRGVKPGEEHAKWVVFPVRESEKLTWQDFAAKNRVAHSTKKRLLLAIVDDEGDVSYWESRWLRP